MQQKSFQTNIAKAISIIFHPVFLPTLVMAFLLFFSPTTCYGLAEKTKIGWIAIVAYTTILFPVLTVFLLWRLKFIESIHMHGLKERYGPLIASMLFYFWIFWVFHKQFAAPIFIQSFLLGVFLTTVFTFMCSIFFKISMHTSGWGSAVMFALLLVFFQQQNSVVFLVTIILIAGLVGSVRLYLQAHTTRQIYIGYAMGFLAQLLAYASIKIIFF